MLLRRFLLRPSVLYVLVLPLLSMPAAGADWPHWRGPEYDGTSSETGLPTTWHAGEGGDENVRWRYDLPGPAGSSPIVWDGEIYLTTAQESGEGLSVVAVGSDGKLRWQTSVDRGSVEVFPQLAHETNAAAPSPVTDGEHLWALFGTAKLYRLTLDGKVTWTVDLAERYGAPSLYFGYSASPLVDGDRLFLHLLHGDGQLVVALDKSTGEELWKQERPTDAEKESLHSYASVVPYAGGEQILVHGADYLTSHDPSTGREIWRFGTLNPKASYNPTYRLVATPAVHDDLIVIPTAKRGPVFGLRPGDAKGSMTPQTERLAWTLERGTPDVPSPVVTDGLVYLCGEDGRLTVLDLATGGTVYAERAHQGPHRASPIAADGKVYLTAVDGTVTVVKAGREFEVLAKSTVGGGRLAASPAVADGVIYLRTAETLFAISGEASAKSPQVSTSSD